MLDLIVRDGYVVDGTGAPGRHADVGISGRRVVAIGRIEDLGARTIDAEGMIVAPGFIDAHTHYDAQIVWDPVLTPSSLHGVTTILGGNCGFTIAPIDPDHAQYILPMLARVEGMSVDALRTGLDLQWTSFGGWLDRLDTRVSVNAGFMCGHSTIRRVVMGDAAVGEEATPDQIAAMKSLLRQSLDGGALGFSTSRAGTHYDHNGDPVPSRFASREEILELASVVGAHEGTWMEISPSVERMYGDDVCGLMADMSVAAGGRSLNWNVLLVRPGESELESRRSKLRASDVAAERGGRVVGMALPTVMTSRLSFDTGVVLEALPGFEILRASREEKLRQLRNPEVRRRLAEGAASVGYRAYSDWANFTVSDVGDVALADLIGRRFRDIAADRGVDPFDALLDVVIEDEFRTGLEPPVQGDDDNSWAERVRVLQDPRTVSGGSDAGAHLDFNKSFGCTSEFLARAVRERKLLTIEEAVRILTYDIAQCFGLIDRGLITPGSYADIVIFDPSIIDCKPITMVADMPAGAERLTAGATGIAHVLVNGSEIIDHDQITGELPGMVLRSGRDTRSK
jgi:N-acyl-D-aspartate/D-glutamate deacylase